MAYRDRLAPKLCAKIRGDAPGSFRAFNSAHASRAAGFGQVFPTPDPAAGSRERSVVMNSPRFACYRAVFGAEHQSPHTRTPPPATPRVHRGTIRPRIRRAPRGVSPPKAVRVKHAQKNGCATPSSSRRGSICRKRAAAAPPPGGRCLCFLQIREEGGHQPAAAGRGFATGAGPPPPGARRG